MSNYIDFVEKKIKKSINLEKIKILDNSHKHKTHKSYSPDKYHLYLEIHSKFLKSLNKIEAQRNIMRVLKEELRTKIHALEIKIK